MQISSFVAVSLDLWAVEVMVRLSIDSPFYRSLRGAVLLQTEILLFTLAVGSAENLGRSSFNSRDYGVLLYGAWSLLF